MSKADLRRAAHRVLLPGFYGTTVPQWLAEALAEDLAGVVYFRQNIGTSSQLAALSKAITDLNQRALIATDEESGNVSRLEHSSGSHLPSAAMLGVLNDLTLTINAGKHIARLCGQAGVNLNLAPVVDVNVNPANPVIGVRSFGADTASVAAHSAAMVSGMQASSTVAACAKHFPGHGDTAVDSHLGLPRVDEPWPEFAQRHIPPFKAVIEAGVKAIMSAHIVVTALGEEPATINSSALSLLRTLGFSGVIVTDALDMAAIRAEVGSGEGAVRALLAGADLLCIGNPANESLEEGDKADFTEVRDAVVAALESGRLSLERLEQSAQRIAQLQADLRPVSTTNIEAPDVDWLDYAEQAIRSASEDTACTRATEIFARLRAQPELAIYDARSTANMAVGATPSYFSAALAELCPIRRADGPVDADIIVVDALYQGSHHERCLAEADASNGSVICLNAGIPYYGEQGATLLNCLGSNPVSAQAVTRILAGARR